MARTQTPPSAWDASARAPYLVQALVVQCRSGCGACRYARFMGSGCGACRYARFMGERGAVHGFTPEDVAANCPGLGVYTTPNPGQPPDSTVLRAHARAAVLDWGPIGATGQDSHHGFRHWMRSRDPSLGRSAVAPRLRVRGGSQRRATGVLHLREMPAPPPAVRRRPRRTNTGSSADRRAQFRNSVRATLSSMSLPRKRAAAGRRRRLPGVDDRGHTRRSRHTPNGRELAGWREHFAPAAQSAFSPRTPVISR
jgi:hypothetical protein